jgi:hypothetical protein
LILQGQIMNAQNRIKTVLALAVAAMAIVGLATASANAAIVVEEQFIYEPPEANIDGQNGGAGFDGPWVSTISHGRIYWVRSPGLEFSTLPVAGNALSRYGSAGRAQAHRLLSAQSKAALTRDNTTIWFSVLFQEPANQYRHGTFLFGTEAFTTDGTPTLTAAGDGFGFTLQRAPDGGGQGDGSINAIAYDNSTAPTVVAGTYTPDPITATSLIVGKINWKPDGTPDELFLFNVTDLTTEPTTPFATIKVDFSQSAFDTIAMWDSNNAITDEIRFGNTFADVMGNTAVDPTLPDVDVGVDVITWSGQGVPLDPNIVEKEGSDWTDLTYAWSAEPDDGVEFSDHNALAPTVTITKATDNPSIVTLTLAVNNVGRALPPVTDTMTIDVYDDNCQAAKAAGLLELDPTDIDGNCITDFDDFAVMATTWLDDYTLKEPVAK